MRGTWLTLLTFLGAIGLPGYATTCLPLLTAPVVPLSRLIVVDERPDARVEDLTYMMARSHRAAVPVAQTDGVWTYRLFISRFETDEPLWRTEFRLNDEGTHAYIDFAERYDEARDLGDWRRFFQEALIRNQPSKFYLHARLVGRSRDNDVTISDVAEALANPLSFGPYRRGGLWSVIGRTRAGQYFFVGYLDGVGGYPQVEAVTAVSANAVFGYLIHSAREAEGRRFQVRSGSLIGREFTFAKGAAVGLVRAGFNLRDILQAFALSMGLVPGGGARFTHWFLTPLGGERWLRLLVRLEDDGLSTIQGGHVVDRSWTGTYHMALKRLRRPAPENH